MGGQVAMASARAHAESATANPIVGREPSGLPESHVATTGSKRDVVLGELRTLRRAGGLWLLSFAA